MTMTHTASGPFSVQMLPQPQGDNPIPGRALLDKRYQGDLAATGQGQMLSAVTATPGSAGYVAIELVTGTLQGRSGSFVLQHSGLMCAPHGLRPAPPSGDSPSAKPAWLMDRGAKRLTITVVPDSATGGLTGLAGQMDIRISDGQHFYELTYTLP
jgi:hypothetical protein